jgi:hypothetical protein
MSAAPPDYTAQWESFLQQRFLFHQLNVKQRLLTIGQRYDLYDSNGYPLFHVVRPPRLRLTMLAGVLTTICRWAFLFFALRLLLQGQVHLAIALLFVSGPLCSVLYVLLAPYRDISVFSDDTQQVRLLSIRQDNKFGVYHWYTIYDLTGAPVARARRNFLLGIFRRQWAAFTPEGELLCVLMEDNFVLALLRRYIGPLWGLLRTNFDVLLPDGTRLGEYNRQLTLIDEYQLNLHGDPYYLIDRRVAVALAVLLDTAEGR